MQSTSSKPAARTGKLSHLLWSFLPLSVFVCLGAALYLRGYWLVMPIAFFLVVIPMLDLVTGWQDTDFFESSDYSAFELFLLRWNPRLYVLLHMAFVIYSACIVTRLAPIEIALLVGCLSFSGGIAFAAAHEILHAKEKIDQILQRITSSFLFYPHYKMIHIRSHHVHTSTDNDENTAWLNETIYAYIARTIPGSAIRCWQMEARQARAGGSRTAAVFRNKMIFYAAGQLLVLLALFLLAGPWGLLFFLAQIIGSHITLESVNYIQHYGLLREKHGSEYEKPGAEHSWDTYHFFSSHITYRVGHHSYHHLAVKPYYALGTEAEAPKLPVGYFWAIPMVFLPPFWRRVINPKLKLTRVPA